MSLATLPLFLFTFKTFTDAILSFLEYCFVFELQYHSILCLKQTKKKTLTTNCFLRHILTCIRPAGNLLVCHILLPVKSFSSSSFPLLAKNVAAGRPFWLRWEPQSHGAPSGCSVVSVDPVGLAAATSGYWVSAGSHVIQDSRR